MRHATSPTNALGIRILLIAPLLLPLFVTGSVLGQAPDQVLASVNGIEITLKQVDDSAAAQIYPLQQQLYALRKVTLENLIVAKLLETEARKRNISVEELRKNLMAGPVNVTNVQVEEAYAQNASFFAAMSPDEAKERLRLDLENQLRMRRYKAALDGLRAQSNISVMLKEPAGLTLDDGLSPTKGARTPVVTIVEFSDFECPFCKEVQSTLTQLLAAYGDQVRLVFKHLPLESHRNAMPAARAAYCASEQDRFWQYHDALFAAKLPSGDGLNTIASELGLNITKFQSCLISDRPNLAILRDLETARRLRIASTPTFVINGSVINGAFNFTTFQKIIESELKQRGSGKTSSSK